MRRYLAPILLALLAASAAPAALQRPAPRAAAPARDLGSATPGSVGISSERLQRLDAGMKRFVDEGRLAGVVTLLARRGKVVDVNAFGRMDVTRPDPIARDAIVRIYSMSKLVTGVAMMMLHEEGKWRLDDPVGRLIPEFARLKVFTGEEAGGGMKLVDATRSMTLRELMTHSGGLAYGLGTANPVDRLYRQHKVLDSSVPLQTMIETLSGLPLLTQPGTRYAYSAGVDVQGYLVEKLSGQPLGQFMQERIFGPIGMIDTAFYVPKEKLGRVARSHTEDAAGGPLQLAPDRGAIASLGVSADETIPPAGPSGGAGLYSTADDYARLCQMLLDGGQLNGVRLLAPRTVEMLRTNHLRPEPLATMRPGVGWGMGPAVIMDAAAAGEPVSTGSFSWSGIAGTWFWVDPVADVVFVGIIQHSGRTIPEVQGISRNLVYQAIVNP